MSKTYFVCDEACRELQASHRIRPLKTSVFWTMPNWKGLQAPLLLANGFENDCKQKQRWSQRRYENVFTDEPAHFRRHAMQVVAPAWAGFSFLGLPPSDVLVPVVVFVLVGVIRLRGHPNPLTMPIWAVCSFPTFGSRSVGQGITQMFVRRLQALQSIEALPHTLPLQHLLEAHLLQELEDVAVLPPETVLLWHQEENVIIIIKLNKI